MSPDRRTPALGLLSGLGMVRHDRHRGEIIHVGRMPRIDTFHIGVEVVPRPRDGEFERQPRGAG